MYHRLEREVQKQYRLALEEAQADENNKGGNRRREKEWDEEEADEEDELDGK